MCDIKTFRVPEEMVYGWGSLSYLKGVKGKRAFIVTDQIIDGLGYSKKVTDYLYEAGFEKVQVFNEVEPDPSYETVENGVKLMQEFQPDWIVGLGGGSPIDAAKAMWGFAVYPNMTWEEFIQPALAPPLRHKIKFISIATTSGTGSEVTSASVVTNRKVTPNRKTPIFGPELCPVISISDPELTVQMPPNVTANTGMDVLVHALEAYTSVSASELDKGLAIHAIKMVFRSLRKACADGRNKVAREDMSTASFMAGASFFHPGLGVIHATAHQLGAQYGIPHGLANCIMMPYVIQFNSLAIPELYAEIADALNIQYTNQRDAVVKLVGVINQLQKDIGQPHTIKDAGVDETTFFEKIKITSEIVVKKDPCTPANARVPSVKDIENLYTAAYYGNDLI